MTVLRQEDLYRILRSDAFSLLLDLETIAALNKNMVFCQVRLINSHFSNIQYLPLIIKDSPFPNSFKQKLFSM